MISKNKRNNGHYETALNVCFTKKQWGNDQIVLKGWRILVVKKILLEYRTLPNYFNRVEIGWKLDGFLEIGLPL